MIGIVLLVFWLSIVPKSDAEIGICYGMIADNLPPPQEVIDLCKQHNIQRLRLYNPVPQALQALQGSGIEVILGVLNEDIQNIASSQAYADQWVNQNVKAFPNVKFKYITLGNEIDSPVVRPFILPAMQNIYNSVNARNKKFPPCWILVSSSSYPCLCSFKEDAIPFIKPIIDFLVSTNGPACFNIYPYFAYAGDTTNIHLDYALGTATSPVVIDGPYAYLTLFDAMVDSLYASFEKLGGGALSIVVTETGWSSEGGLSTTVETAAIYNSKLVPHIAGGTPRRPGKPIETYIFALFDENWERPLIEQHWGVVLIQTAPKYPLSFN
ncbi:hypothetical protein Leryth_027247 [Lithospermum erythrorhizon]|nr:hypothetical protein Leryth_027247 [Lithospermum erythrorhizon]